MIDVGSNVTRAEQLVDKALIDDSLIDRLIDGISPERKSHETRDECAEALKLLSDRRPEVLYGRWDELVRMLSSDNAFSVSPALYIIANLVAIDRDHKFDQAIDAYMRLLDDKSITVASRVVINSGKIVKLRPDMEPLITARLLSVNSSDCKQKELLKSYVIESLDSYFDRVTDKSAVLDFVSRQAESTSGKTKKSARDFLKKH